jgi:cytochrome c551/c552
VHCTFVPLTDFRRGRGLLCVHVHHRILHTTGPSSSSLAYGYALKSFALLNDMMMNEWMKWNAMPGCGACHGLMMEVL